MKIEEMGKKESLIIYSLMTTPLGVDAHLKAKAQTDLR